MLGRRLCQPSHTTQEVGTSASTNLETHVGDDSLSVNSCKKRSCSLRMPSLGITGGIASGKSTFCQLLLEYIQAEFFDADACVSELLEGEESVKEAILNKVHPAAYGVGGRPDRALLRELIYRDTDKKQLLEAILHPIVRKRWMERAQEATRAGRIFVADIPLLFETSAEAFFDRLITVGCAPETQLARLSGRPGMTLEISKKIIASQLPIDVKVSRSHHVIWNDGLLDALTEQTKLFSRYLHDRYG
jgi:dephospho-CoA kinase